VFQPGSPDARDPARFVQHRASVGCVTGRHADVALVFGILLSSCGRARLDVAPPESASRAAHQPMAPKDTSARAGADATTDAAIGSPAAPAARSPVFQERRDEREALVRVLIEEGIQDGAVLQAMRTVPRHAFVLPALRIAAYANHPLPIVGGQTISQPYIVAFMTEAARPTARSRCLEIGTGSGYQAAVLAELCQRTYSIEYLPEVARFGERNLRELGYGPGRVALRVGDGYEGWPEAAPFDTILVTAAPEHVPEPLLDQLAIGGRLVIPVGATHDVQELERWTRLRAGKDSDAFRRETLLPVRFVPFAGKGAGK
jgi:protein-L-isoaspartate(D-aspartate) O-methyltransferase